MMFVIKGVVNLSNDEVGELAFVSYQGTAGDYYVPRERESGDTG